MRENLTPNLQDVQEFIATKAIELFDRHDKLKSFSIGWLKGVPRFRINGIPEEDQDIAAFASSADEIVSVFEIVASGEEILEEGITADVTIDELRRFYALIEDFETNLPHDQRFRNGPPRGRGCL